MKVWSKVCDQYSPSIHEICDRYKEYAPTNVEWVDDFMEADVCIDHLIGTPDRKNLVNPLERSFSEEVKLRLELAKEGMFKMAYVMHCSIVPDLFYMSAISEAIISTGFLDVDNILGRAKTYGDKWLRVAWGVRTEDFLLPMRKKDPEYLIYTFGASADPEVECLESIYKACKQVGGRMLHSGYDYRFDSGEHYHYVAFATSKQEIAQRYNSCWFANAMRREEGFELANIEAPLSNARPITLSIPPYTDFFEAKSSVEVVGVKNDHYLLPIGSIFVDPNRVEEDLVRIFSKEKFKVPQQHKNHIIKEFNWRKTCQPFWEKILEYCRSCC